MKKQLMAILLSLLLGAGIMPASVMADGDDAAAMPAVVSVQEQKGAQEETEAPVQEQKAVPAGAAAAVEKEKDKAAEPAGGVQQTAAAGQVRAPESEDGAEAAGGLSFKPYVFTVDEVTGVSAAVELQPGLMQITPDEPAAEEQMAAVQTAEAEEAVGPELNAGYFNLTEPIGVQIGNSTGVTFNSTGAGTGNSTEVPVVEEVRTDLTSASYTYNGTAVVTFITSDLTATYFELYAYTTTDPGEYFGTMDVDGVTYYEFGLQSFGTKQDGVSIVNATTENGAARGVTLSSVLYSKEGTVLPLAGTDVYFAVETENMGGSISNLVRTTVAEGETPPLVSLSNEEYAARLGNETEKFVFNGGSQQPNVIIFNNATNEKLIAEKDYTLIYGENTNAGPANVTVVGKGLYTDNITLSFTIDPCELNEENTFIMLENAVDNMYFFNGTAINPQFSVMYESQAFTATLQEDVDYTYKVTGNDEPGEGLLTVTGKNNFAGEVNQTFQIVEKEKISLDSDYTKITVTPYGGMYTGQPQTRNVSVSYDGEALVEGQDYSLEYSDNVHCGPAFVTVIGTGDYKDNKTAEFVIKEAPINSENTTVTLDPEEGTYAGGNPVEPAITVTFGGQPLASGTDYSVQFFNNTAVGSGKVSVIALTGSDFTGNITKEFRINPASVATNTQIVLTPCNFTYSGRENKPAVTVISDGKELAQNTDFKAVFSENIKAGEGLLTVIGIGNFTNNVTASFTINPDNISNGSTVVKLDKEAYIYNGGVSIEPQVSVTRNGEELKQDTDYSVKYEANENAGTGRVIVIGEENYEGEFTENFTIEKLPVTSDQISAELSNTSLVYTGEDLEPEVTVTLNGRALEKDKDYTLTYEQNREVGTATVRIRGINNLDGEISLEFGIREPEIYKVTFDANGGDGSMNASKAIEGQPYTLPECTFTPPEGKEFDAWDKGAPGEEVSITADTVITAQWKDKVTVYPVISVVNQTWTGIGNVAVRIDAPYRKLISVDVDNITLSKPAQYVDEEGSTIIRLQESFLKTLKPGEHTMTAWFTDGKTVVKFWVKAADQGKTTPAANKSTSSGTSSPRTGDDSSFLLWISVLLIAAACGTGLVLAPRRRRRR